MPVIVIDEATDLDGLTARLLRSNASDATRAAAARALREANPGLDLRSVPPGTVVVVPELHAGLRNPAGSVADGAAAATDRVETQLGGLAAAFADGASRRAAVRSRAAEALADPEVERRLDSDPRAKAVAQRLQAQLEHEQEQAEEQAALLEAALSAWGDDLASLQDAWKPTD